MSINELKKILKHHLLTLENIEKNNAEIEDELLDKFLEDIKHLKELNFNNLSQEDIQKITKLTTLIIDKIKHLKEKTLTDIYSLNQKSEAIKKYHKY